MAERLSDKDYGDIYSRAPRATVDLIIETPEGLLLVKRQEPPNIGSWHMPGGGIRMQETLEEAAKRIAQSELGVEIQLGEVIGYDEYLYEQKDFGKAHSIGIMIRAQIVDGNLDALIKSGTVEMFKDLPENTMGPHEVALEKFWHPKEW